MTRNRFAAALVAGCLLLANQCMAKPPDLPVDLKVRCEEKGAPTESANALRTLDLEGWTCNSGLRWTTGPDEPECYPCPDACLAVGGCLGWTVQALLGQCPTDAEQLTVMPKVVRRKRNGTDAPAQSRLPQLPRLLDDSSGSQLRDLLRQEEQDARELEELHRRSHQLRLQSQTTPGARQEEDASRERMARRLFRIAEGCRRDGDHEMAYNCYCEVELLVPNSSLGERARKQMAECQRQLGAAEEAEPNEDDMVDKLELE